MSSFSTMTSKRQANHESDGRQQQTGFALVSVMLLLALLMTMVIGYFTLTRIEQTTTRSSMDSFRGFYASEAGLNVRAKEVRDTFVGYNLPTGTSPDPGASDPVCTGTNVGAGDFACASYDFQDRFVSTYMTETPGNPTSIVIPRGEPFQNLNAQEYRYTTYSSATNSQNLPEAVLEMRFKSRLVPMFQFAAFYNKDLEILPGPAMTLAGPVHTNGDLYMGSNDIVNGLQIAGQVTAVGDIYQGRKNVNDCMPGDTAVLDPTNMTPLPHCVGSRKLYTTTDVYPWNDMVQMGFDTLTVPAPEALDPTPGEIYWDKADIRIVLNLNGTPAIQVHNADGTVDSTRSSALNACSGTPVLRDTDFYNNREAAFIEMLDIDTQGLMNCIHNDGLLDSGKLLNDTTEGGLVWYLTVMGPDQSVVNNYGVRLRNGSDLDATAGGAPPIQGLTVVTNQAVYIQGDYNKDANKKPAAFLADSLNILSEGWNDTESQANLDAVRVVAEAITEINAAFLAGTDSTGGIEGAGGQDLNGYNGGLENYPRFHEKWSGKTLRYRGSFVSLNLPRHVDGAWVYGAPYYKAPIRDFGYDTDFDNASNLPPLSPRFVYLRQELFVRQFDL